MMKPLIVAHRAQTPGAIENSLSAVQLAAAHGADLIELDIRLALDRTPMVLHDAMLRRTTRARGWVRLWPSMALTQFALRDAADSERLSTLDTVLRHLPDGIQPALHLKDRTALPAVLRLIRRHDIAHRTWLWLEHPRDVSFATRKVPDLRVTLLRPRGWHPEAREQYMTEAQWVGAAGVSLPAGVVDLSLTTLAHQHRLRVFTRIDSADEAPRLLTLGVSGFITDNPAAVHQQLLGVAPGEQAAE